MSEQRWGWRKVDVCWCTPFYLCLQLHVSKVKEAELTKTFPYMSMLYKASFWIGAVEPNCDKKWKTVLKKLFFKIMITINIFQDQFTYCCSQLFSYCLSSQWCELLVAQKYMERLLERWINMCFIWDRCLTCGSGWSRCLSKEELLK